jgi:hypothetical protein
MVDWGEMEAVCFSDGLQGLKRNHVYASIGALGLAAMLIVYLFTIWQLLGLLGPHVRAGRSRWHDLIFQHRGWNSWLGGHLIHATAVLVVPLGLSVPLLWVVFYLRRLQKDLADGIFNDYEGTHWGFGQIVSMVIFAPVPVNMAYQARFGQEW